MTSVLLNSPQFNTMPTEAKVYFFQCAKSGVESLKEQLGTGLIVT